MSIRTAGPVPDGGWGWVVVIATLTFNIIYDGCSYSFGILYTDLLKYFGDTKSNTAWIGSLFFSVPLLCAPVAAVITSSIGSRRATMLGGMIAAIGFFFSAFSTSVWMLVVSYGLVGGFGMSLPYFNSLKTVTDYFDKRLAFASGIAESGAGLGTVLFAPFTQYLVTTYGWRGTLIILSGITANIIVCGTLYRPVNGQLKQNNSETGELNRRHTCHCCHSDSNSIELQPGSNEEHEMTTPTLVDVNEVRTKRGGYRHHLKNIPFLVFAFANFVMYFWYDVPYVFLYDRSVDIGIGADKSSYFLSIIGFVHLFGIIAYGYIGDISWMSREVLYGVSTVLCGVVIALVPFLFHFSELAVVAGCFGLFSAASEALLSCVLIDIVGKEAFDRLFCGLVLFMEGVANLVGPPVAGLLFDKTGNYDMTFYSAGCCLLLAGSLYVVLSCAVKKESIEVRETENTDVSERVYACDPLPDMNNE